MSFDHLVQKSVKDPIQKVINHEMAGKKSSLLASQKRQYLEKKESNDTHPLILTSNPNANDSNMDNNLSVNANTPQNQALVLNFAKPNLNQAGNRTAANPMLKN